MAKERMTVYSCFGYVVGLSNVCLLPEHPNLNLGSTSPINGVVSTSLTFYHKVVLFNVRKISRLSLVINSEV